MVVVGIDYSLTSPGLTVFSGSEFSWKKCEFYSLSNYDIPNFKNFHFEMHRTWKSPQDRYNTLATWALSKIPSNTDIISLEGYSMGSRGRAVFDIGEAGGILRHMIWLAGYNFSCVAPTSNKKFAFGKGNATKDQMYEAWLKETGFDLKATIQPKRKLDSPTTDIVDSYFLAMYGAKILMA